MNKQVQSKTRENGKWLLDHSDDISSKLEQVNVSAAMVGKKMSGVVKRYPLQSAVGAALVGLFLGAKIFGRHPNFEE